jgi:hypothetical protein
MDKKDKRGAQRGLREIPATQLARVRGGEGASEPPDTSSDFHLNVSTRNLIRDR